MKNFTEELKESLNLEEEYLYEMAYSRADAMERCYSLGKRFIEHFDKIYKESQAQAVNHWCAEMQAWYNNVREITLKPKNKHLNRTQMRDWFYTFGSDPTEYFKNNDENETYEEFIDELENTNSVYEAIQNILF